MDVEEQLSREYTQVDRLSLCIAGTVLPSAAGCRSYNWERDNSTSYRRNGGREYTLAYSAYRAKLTAWSRWGIQCYELPTKLALAQHLVVEYRYDQRAAEEHSTFRVPLRTKRPMGRWKPAVLSLMGIADADTGRTFIGPEIANCLECEYGSLSAVFNAAAADLANLQLRSGRKIGMKMASRIKRAGGA